MRLDRPLRLAARSRRTLAKRFHRLAPTDEAALLVLSVPVGALTALGVLAFYRGISAAHAIFLVAPATLLPPLGLLALRPIVLAAAFAAASAVMRHLGHDHDGMNVPDIIRAVASRGGRIPVRPALARTIASAITIGGGGSAGSEGPLVVGGAGIGSWVARVFRTDSSVTRVLAGCGTAAAISAAFNAPLAGAFFALEEVLGAFSGASFSPVVVASVVSAVVARGLFGSAPAFPVPATLGAPDFLQVWVLLPVLGVVSALVSALYVRTYFAAENAARSPRVPRGARPLIGGVIVGLLLFASQGALAGDIHLAAPLDLFGALPWWTLFALAVGKVLATSVTLNFGGSGGVFTPSLFIGAATGGAFGSLCAQLVPGHTIDPALYAVAGMGAHRRGNGCPDHGDPSGLRDDERLHARPPVDARRRRVQDGDAPNRTRLALLRVVAAPRGHAGGPRRAGPDGERRHGPGPGRAARIDDRGAGTHSRCSAASRNPCCPWSMRRVVTWAW